VSFSPFPLLHGLLPSLASLSRPPLTALPLFTASAANRTPSRSRSIALNKRRACHPSWNVGIVDQSPVTDHTVDKSRKATLSLVPAGAPEGISFVGNGLGAWRAVPRRDGDWTKIESSVDRSADRN
jgi:hypothetical protein